MKYVSILLLVLLFNKEIICQTKFEPEIVKGERIKELISKIPSNVDFFIGDLVFYNDTLYVASNIGLLQIHKDKIVRILKWNWGDDVISGPWVDKTNNELWILHNHYFKLIKYNGKTWQAYAVPKRKDGYTRGNILEGFRIVNSENPIWLVGGNCGWEWNKQKESWIELPLPDEKKIAYMFTYNNKICAVIRNDEGYNVIGNNKFRSDQLFVKEETWKEIPNKSNINIYLKSLKIVNKKPYLLSERGELFEISQNGIVHIPQGDNCSIIEESDSQGLLVYKKGKGLFALNDNWKEIFKIPRQLKGEFFTYIASSGKNVAMVFTPESELKNGKFILFDAPSLWVFYDGKLTEITF